jgi:hypothetical protein
MQRKGRGRRPTLPALPSLQPPPEAQLANRYAMRGEWRDPDDTTPTAARVARTVVGYRGYDPLRKCRRRHGDASSVTERHIVAADILRGLADGAAIGFTAPRDLSLPVQAVTYRPSLGPTRTAERQTRCWRRFVKAMAVFTRAQRELLTLAVLLNTSVHRIAAARGLQAPILMGQLVACLDMLAQHLAAEVDEAMARGLAA